MKRAIIPVAAALAALGVFVALRGSGATGSSEATGSPEAVTHAGTTPVTEEVAAPVTADLIWDETLEAVRCLRDEGIEVLGPVPSSSGLGVYYGITSTPESEEAEERCAADLGPMARRFAFANGSQEGPDGHAVPATDEGRRLGAIGDRLEACLVAAGITLDEPGMDADWPLTRAAEDHPAEFDVCVRGL